MQAKLEILLRLLLPAEMHSAIPLLTSSLVGFINGSVLAEEAQAQLSRSTEVAAALRALAGQQVNLSSSVISFGSGSQVGDITINGNVAGRDVVNLNIIVQFPSPKPIHSQLGVSTIESTTSSKSGRPDHVDIAIITALPDELSPVLRWLKSGERYRLFSEGDEGFSFPHHYAEIQVGEKRLSVVACALWQMGQRSTSNAVARVARLKPKLIAMTGICAGYKEKGVRRGDVIIATSAFDAQSGKNTLTNTRYDTSSAAPPPWLISWLQALNDNDNWFKRITCKKPGATKPKAHYGSFATTFQVVEKNTPFAELEVRVRSVRAIEMEVMALYEAASEWNLHAIAVKGVTDYAEPGKDDRYRKYAAEASLCWLIAFLELVSDHFFNSHITSHLVKDAKIPTPAQVIAYLTSLQVKLSSNRLLEQFGRKIDNLRLPLQAVPFTPSRDQEILRRREELRLERGLDDETSFKVYIQSNEAHEHEATIQTLSEQLDDLVDRVDCAVVLGDPGSGKTEWLRWRTRQDAEEVKQALIQGVALEKQGIPIFARLDTITKELIREDEQLINALEKAGCDVRGLVRLDATNRLAAAIVLATASNTSALPLLGLLWGCLSGMPTYDSVPLRIYLDAWDEVREGHEYLEESLPSFIEAGRAKIVLTSRIVDYNSGLLPTDGMYATTRRTFQIQPFTWGQTVEFIKQFFADDSATRDRMREQLQAYPSITGLAQNPLIATLICTTFAPGDDYQSLQLPARRVEIYERILRRLLTAWAIKHRRLTIASEMIDDLLILSASLAFHLFPIEVVDVRKMETFIANHIKSLQEYNPLHRLIKKSGLKYIRRLLCDSGIIVPFGRDFDGNETFTFLHLTFQEYLAARHLADQVYAKNNSWEKVEIGIGIDQNINLGEFIRQRSWLPEWQEVLILFSGRVANPQPLLQLLVAHSPQHEDDIFRHRLALAAQCLPELDTHQRHILADLLEIIARENEKVWKKFRSLSPYHIKRAILSLFIVGSEVISANIKDALGWRSGHDISTQLDIISLIVSSFPFKYQHLLDEALGNINDDESVNRSSAKQTVVIISKKSIELRERAADELNRWLSISDPYQRHLRHVLHTLTLMGGVIAHRQDVLDSLLQLLNDQSCKERGNIPKTIFAIWKGTTLHQYVLERLFLLLDDIDGEGHGYVLSTIESLQALSQSRPVKTVTTIQGSIINNADALLHAKDWSLEEIRAVGRMGRAVIAHPTLIDRLVHYLEDKNPYVRSAAVISLVELQQILRVFYKGGNTRVVSLQEFRNF